MFRKVVVLFILSLFVLFTLSYAEEIGRVETKGLFFKDHVKVEAFDDPTIEGITCYTTVYERALSLEDSSSVSLSCRQVGVIKGELKTKKNIFRKSKSVFFKETIVDRFYDRKRGVMVYLTYTKDVGGRNASNSVSVVVIKNRKE